MNKFIEYFNIINIYKIINNNYLIKFNKILNKLK